MRLEVGNDGDSDIDVEVDELLGNEENTEQENELVPYEIFTQISWNIFVDSSCLIQKRMLVKRKKDVQLAVKKYCMTEHYKIIVVESNQNIWYVR